MFIFWFIIFIQRSKLLIYLFIYIYGRFVSNYSFYLCDRFVPDYLFILLK